MTPQKEILLNFLNTYIPYGVLLTFIIVIILYILYFTKLRNNPNSKLAIQIKNIALPVAFFLTLFGTIISLIYSDYLGEAPCGLCWLQRIFIFSQVILYMVAYLRNDLKIFSYTIWLSIVGGVIALYHSWLQLGYSDLIPCPVTPGLVDCAKPTFLAFGFVTVPFSSLMIFLVLIFLSLIVSEKHNK